MHAIRGNAQGVGSSVSALVIFAAISSTVASVACRVSSNRPLRLRNNRGMGVEKTGMMIRIAEAMHNDHLMAGGSSDERKER